MFTEKTFEFVIMTLLCISMALKYIKNR
jgi:hypothetical protein